MSTKVMKGVNEMAKFSKSWNPRKRRPVRKPDPELRQIQAVKKMLSDKREGIELPIEHYRWIAEGMQE